MLLLLSGGGESKTKVSESDSENLAAYAKELEKGLSEIISSIEGAGKAQVMITFDSSFENVYAYNAGVSESGVGASGRSTEKELVLTGNKNDESPVLVKRLTPRIKGVLVVCEGGGSSDIAKKVSSAAGTLFGIAESRICVTDGTRGEE